MSAPFRIRRAAADPMAPRGTAPLPAAPDDIQHWMERLTKLIPAEVLAVYVAGRGMAESFVGVWAAVCLALVLVIRVWGTREPGERTQWTAVVIATISFVIWVYAIGDRLLDFQLPNPAAASLAMLVWTVLVPVIYKGE